MPLEVDRIAAARPANRIHYYPVVGSTMQTAALLAAEGAPHGTVVVADEQTAGQGRLGRSWVSERDAGLYCSVLLRLWLPPAKLPIATLLLGLATADAIQTATNVVCDLRWPNDVLIRERKVAGILAQLSGDCIIAGIGINVAQVEMPDALRTPATSLRIESKGRCCGREELLVALLHSLDEFGELLQVEGTGAIVAAFSKASSYVLNRRVTLEEKPEAKATTAGLDENGFLLVRFDDGATERIAAGGVRAVT